MAEQGTLNIGSGNDERRGPGPPAFLVVEHNGRKVAIGRNPNYQETIASLKKNVHEFKSTSNDQIIMLAFLTEVDDHVQLTEEVWADLLPRLVTIRVGSNNVSHNPSASPSVVSDENPLCTIPPQEEAAAAEVASTREVQLEAMREQQEAALAKLNYEVEAEKSRQRHRGLIASRGSLAAYIADVRLNYRASRYGSPPTRRAIPIHDGRAAHKAARAAAPSKRSPSPATAPQSDH